MTIIHFTVLAILLAVSVDAKDPRCPDESYTGPIVFYPDYSDCSWYYECNHGDMFHLKCLPNAVWDAVKEDCVYYKFTDCAHTYAPGQSTVSTVAPTPPTGPTGSTTWPTTSVLPPGTLCHGKGGGEIVFDPTDCSRYAQCFNGVETYHYCAHNTYIDKETRTCSSWYPDRC